VLAGPISELAIGTGEFGNRTPYGKRANLTANNHRFVFLNEAV